MQTDNFDELKNLWKTKNEPSELNDSEIIESVKERLKTNQRKLVFSNLILSVSFAFVFIVIGWIWNSFPDRTPTFYISLCFMGFLLLSFIAVMWAGVNFGNVEPAIETEKFINASINKIKLRIYAIKYATPAFMFLLLLTFFFYYADVLAEETTLIKFLVYAATTIYFLIIALVSNKKRKKSLQENYELIEYLNRWRNSDF